MPMEGRAQASLCYDGHLYVGRGSQRRLLSVKLLTLQGVVQVGAKVHPVRCFADRGA
jgi:hypothetical protein